MTLTGAGLAGAAQVFFGGVATVPMGGGTDTRLTATVPAGALTGPVSVRVPGGIYTSTAEFTVLDGGPAPVLPTLTGASPDHGRPGTVVTLRGTGLRGTALVDFGGAAALEWRVVDDSTVLAEVPPMAAPGPLRITVATDAGLAQFGPFTVDPAAPVPAITRFDPAQGPPGTQVTLQGTGFAGTTEVTFGGEAALDPVVNPDGSLTATVPADAPSGPIGVVAPGGFARSDADFQVLPPAPPDPTVLVPSEAHAGDSVTLLGTGLDQVERVGFSTVGGQAPAFTDAILAADANHLTVVVPPQAATGPLTLAYPGGRVAVPGVFTFRLSPPVLTGVEPLAALPGAEVTLTGRNLLRASQVTFGGVSLEGRFTVVSDTEVRVRMSDDGEAGTAGLLGIVTPAGATVFGQPCRFLDSASMRSASSWPAIRRACRCWASRRSGARPPTA